MSRIANKSKVQLIKCGSLGKWNWEKEDVTQSLKSPSNVSPEEQETTRNNPERSSAVTDHNDEVRS